MKVYQTNEIKNIALLGNDGSGKTTLTEALLFESGIIKRRGRITAKNTVSDYFPVEQEYGYSVFSTVYHVEWNGKKLNIIDCPGSDDFVGAAITGSPRAFLAQKVPTYGRHRLVARTDRRGGILCTAIIYAKWHTVVIQSRISRMRSIYLNPDRRRCASEPESRRFY